MSDVAPRSLNVLSLCSGYGGLDLAVRRAVRGARTVCYVEREAYVAAILAARMEDGGLDPAPIWTDLTTFDASAWRGAVDLVTAGFPCQDISVAGKGAGIGGERSGLWKHVARVIAESGVRYAFLENVSALVRRGLDVVLQDLAAMGFDAEWGCYTAREVGASHKRERIFILAYRNSFGLGKSGTEHAREPDTRERSESMAHAASNGRDERVRRVAEARGRTVARDGIEELADTNGDGCERQNAHVRSGQPRQGDVVLARSSEALPDTERGELREQQGRFGGTCGRGTILASSSSSAWPSPFPPGPDDHDGWARLLAADPTVEPAVRRDVNGFTSRVDRLRALGNGVVPQQAERALREFWERAHRA